MLSTLLLFQRSIILTIHDPFQPGPIYFLTPRKCAIFGVCCEADPRQITKIKQHWSITCLVLCRLTIYLINEACNTGKGGNTIILMLHHFLAVHGFWEKKVHFHCDNYCGQNKNRFLMYYLMYRILAGLHDEIVVSFLPVRHTKFSPDWCFGLFKRHFRRCRVGCLDDIVKVVNESAKPNVAQLVGSQDGELIVPMY